LESSSSRDKKDRRHSILVVEDDDLMRRFYKSLFDRLEGEFISHSEKTGKSALAYLRGNPIDAMIVDWDMPEMSGITLIRILRGNPTTKAMSIIMVSGRSSVEDHLQALNSGADDYLTKPIEVDILLARLRGLLRR